MLSSAPELLSTEAWCSFYISDKSPQTYPQMIQGYKQQTAVGHSRDLSGMSLSPYMKDSQLS